MIVVFGAVIASGLILLFELSGYNLSPENRQLISIILVLSSIITYVYFRARQYRASECWSLDENILSRGDPTNYAIDLSEIEKVISGLPKSRQHNFWSGGVKLFGREFKLKGGAILTSVYNCTIILKLGPTTYLPLYLFNLGGGLEIMNAIALKVSSKLDAEYEFNDAERKVLKPRKLNYVVQL